SRSTWKTIAGCAETAPSCCCGNALSGRSRVVVLRDAIECEPKIPCWKKRVAPASNPIVRLRPKSERGGTMPLARLTDFLDSHNIKYVVITHSVAYTAQGIAALTHISEKELAKTVIVNLDQSLVMVVVPASSQVDLARLKTTAGATNAGLTSEHEFKNKIPHFETGGMPPFGNLYDFPVFSDENFTRPKKNAFNPGTHPETFRLG